MRVANESIHVEKETYATIIYVHLRQLDLYFLDQVNLFSITCIRSSDSYN